MSGALPAYIDLEAFAQRAQHARKADPARVARAGLNLVDGALRIRRGGDGLYGEVERPTTKPVEAVGAWIRALEREASSGSPFYRSAEMREALVAAAEEVDKAAQAMPQAERLRGALYADAIEVLGAGDSGSRNLLPWIVAAIFGGICVGLLVAPRLRSRK